MPARSVSSFYPKGVSSSAHNAGRPTDGSVRAEGVKEGNVLVGTEEEFQDCSKSGRIMFSDLTDSLGGEPASQSTLTAPYRMTALDSFHPLRNPPGGDTADITECSAHYFEVSGSSVAAAWYGQGLRVIDASNARNLRQVGYYYVVGTDPDTNPSSLSWDTAWRGDLVYVMDMDRGIEILRLKGGPRAAAKLATVREPRARVDRLAKVPVAGSGLTAGSLVCPLFAAQGV